MRQSLSTQRRQALQSLLHTGLGLALLGSGLPAAHAA